MSTAQVNTGNLGSLKLTLLTPTTFMLRVESCQVMHTVAEQNFFLDEYSHASKWKLNIHL